MPPLTRFAPSPTGPLHLGHVAAMLYVWGLAERELAGVQVRIEDHDRQRCRPRYLADLQVDLEWLQCTPCRGGAWSRQALQGHRYREALERLRAQGLVYACRCSRKDLPAVAGQNEPRYPGVCRHLGLPETPDTCLRIHLPDEEVRFFDGGLGWQTQRPAAQCGDLVLRDRHGNWTYQFCVVVDDLADRIDWVIRGADLLASTGRQLLLARALGRTDPLAFFHHPLILAADGAKLSKRDGAPPISKLRREGVSPAGVLGRAAHAVGLIPAPAPLRLAELGELFRRGVSGPLLEHPFRFGNDLVAAPFPPT
ncbi:MAG: glutamate--tRNA ligase family protein [Planctomycetales bacterium]